VSARRRGTIAAAAILAAFAGHAAPAAADPPPRGVQALDCRSLAAAAGPANVWWTAFRGERSNLWDQVQAYSVTACFLAEADCRAWLYWAQSDYPDRMVSTPCRRGL